MSEHSTDLSIMSMLSTHFQDVEEFMYLGPDNGAHYPVFFTKPRDILKKYMQLKTFAQVLRMTASLYTEPVRQLPYAENVWCFGQDFDFDRNGWEDVDRYEQESALAKMCRYLPPTFAAQTRNGYHLFWLLEKPEPIFGYAYPASMIQKRLKADAHSVVPVHCLSAFATGRKHARLVDAIELETLNDHIELFPHNFNVYNTETILDRVNPEPNPQIRVLRSLIENTKWSAQKNDAPRTDNGFIEYLIEKYDIVGLLRKAGCQAYARGDQKIIMCCPYHNDRSPSSFLNLDPNSEYYGLFSCVSTNCAKKVMLPTLLRDIGVSL